MAHTLAAVFGKRVLAGNLRAGHARPLQLDKTKTRLLHKEKIQVQQPLYG